jgi:hypothetical protein
VNERHAKHARVELGGLLDVVGAQREVMNDDTFFEDAAFGDARFDDAFFSRDFCMALLLKRSRPPASRNYSSVA